MRVVAVFFLAQLFKLTAGFIDVRHRFSLPRIPKELKQQIELECRDTYNKFSYGKPIETVSRDVPPVLLNEDNMPIPNQCPIQVYDCVVSKTNAFLEHCHVTCNPTGIEVQCWNDDCFKRATRICEEKFWNTVTVNARKWRKKRRRCLPDLRHCYKLACLKCLGRECDIHCSGAGVQYSRITLPHWKGYTEYKKYFPQVKEISENYVFVEEKETPIIDDY